MGYIISELNSHKNPDFGTNWVDNFMGFFYYPQTYGVSFSHRHSVDSQSFPNTSHPPLFQR